jgi:hypothetical protein
MLVRCFDFILVLCFLVSLFGSVSVNCQSPRSLPTSKSVPLIWPDQLNIDPSNTAQNQFIASHYVGSQKLTVRLSQAIRDHNPNFLVLQYHKAYGVDIQGNIVGPNTWANDMETTFDPWVASHTTPACRDPENYFLHYNNISAATRVQHYFNNIMEFYLANPTSQCWIEYIINVTVSRCQSINFDGVFFDVAYFPYYEYEPGYRSGGPMWFEYPPWNWPSIPSDPPTVANNWNAWVVPYWAAVHAGLHAGSLNYLVLPNPDKLITSWYLDVYLNSTDGAFVEGFFSDVYDSDWQLAAGRVLRFITGRSTNKVMIAQPYPSTMAERIWSMGNYLLLRNSKSYLSYGSCTCWYPEWELNLGDYESEPPDLLSDMLNNVYFRKYTNGLVLVNPTSNSQQYTLDRTYYQVSFWGGGQVDSNGVPPPYNITIDTTPLTGTVTVPSRSALILSSQPTPPPPFTPTVLNPPTTTPTVTTTPTGTTTTTTPPPPTTTASPNTPNTPPSSSSTPSSRSPTLRASTAASKNGISSFLSVLVLCLL